MIEMNDTTITVKTDKKVKKESKQLFAELVLDMSTAINMFLRQCLKEEGIPFKASKKVNSVTLKALQDADDGIGVHGPFNTFDEMMEDIMNAED